MKKRTGNEIRQLFLDYFASKGHMIEPGASLIPNNDPTLLWINAGVAALKKYFDGSEKPRNNRIANAQKSIRTNDIENVGKTARHHTFFEMLGNFSIGDYFKKDALHFAWEFLTSPDYIGLDPKRIYVSVYTDDLEAYRIWVEEIGFDPERILKTNGNFWEIGAGPSGPDSEIFYDRGETYDPEGLGERLFFEELENDRYIEVWNVVFSQFDANPELPRSEYKELPQKNIDTGMGLERLVSIVQEGETNYDTDLFLPVIREVEKLASYPYQGEYKMAYRVIADHIRTVTFALSDGALFSNNGRGYVLRRVLRRAIRYGIKLGINKPFMYQLVDIVSFNMSAYYPYLSDKVAFNRNLIQIEEETFHKTLDHGESLLNEALKTVENGIFSGEVAFKLYDTYGFPFELTEEIVQEEGYKVDRDGFDAQMKKQKERARNARGEVASMTSQSRDLLNFEKPSTFIGYESLHCEATIIGLFLNGEKVDTLSQDGEVVFDQTCFYAESGGQVADQGIIQVNGVNYEVKDVKKAPHGQFLHSLEVHEPLHMNQTARLQVDTRKRRLTTIHHSATHLLQSALRKVIGTHITQAGSYVSSEYLRFDFTHFEKISKEQLDKIEELVNEFIQMDQLVEIRVQGIEEAKQSGAIAMFDEKYGDEVRVVAMGDVSKEFCGGSHVNRTGDIGVFRISSEESIGSGVRRIVATSGYQAYTMFKQESQRLSNVASILKVKSVQAVEEKTLQVIQQVKDLQKQIETLEAVAQKGEVENLLKEAKQIGNTKVLIKRFDNNQGNLKDIAVSLREQLGTAIIFLANVQNDKIVFASSISKDAIEGDVNAGNLVKIAAQICEGNGGGRPDLAQAGGKNVSKIDEALEEITRKIGLTL